LGDRKGIEQITKTWEKTVVDRTGALENWVDVCFKIQKRGVTIFAYANNHYSGYAPATLEMFLNLWKNKKLPPIDIPESAGEPPASLPVASGGGAPDFAAKPTPKSTRKSARKLASHTKSLFE
jgi:hypothetical protein